MYSTFNYNAITYNNRSLGTSSADQDNIVFNGYSLQNDTICSSILLHDSMPKRDIKDVNIPRGDGQNIIGDYWREKVITVEGVVRKKTSLLFEAELDAMKKNLAKGEGILDIKINGVIRRYIATPDNVSKLFAKRRGYHVTFCPFEVDFYCADPFGYSVEYESTFRPAESDLIITDWIVHGGTAKAKPIIILSFVSASGITGISFTNHTRSEEIELIASISSSDLVVIDSENKVVTINGVEQDYSGSFPLLDSGGNSYTIEVFGSSAVYDVTIKYKDTYY